MDSPSSAEYFCFKDCLAQRLISSAMSTRSTDLSPSSSDASELDDFVSYLASEIWPTLPETIRKASYETQTSIPDLETLSLDTTPTSFVDTLISYGLSPDEEGCQSFVRKVLDIYIRDVTSPPPVWSKTRTEECEMCERDGVPLTYHHLIPRSVHDKALKKKWHTEAMLNSVAWLCRPCHNTVHRVASNEDLARYYYTMKFLMAREDIQKWQNYAAKQRRGVRRH